MNNMFATGKDKPRIDMKVFSGLGELKQKLKKSVVAIGVFDGVHRGHQQLIKKAVAKAKKINGTSLVVTFWPHPAHVLRPEIQLPLLVSLEHRLRLIEELGVDACLVIKFTKQFSLLSPRQFINKYFVHKIKPEEIFVGYDFRFGQNRSGGLELFKEIGSEFGFGVNILHAVRGGKQVISSTCIRELIANAKLTKVSRLLGRHVSIMGTVLRGDDRGKTVGFPTANLYPTIEIIPPLGVYAVRIILGNKTFRGMANIGRKPSFKKSNGRVNIEVHIFDFKKQIYGKKIIVEFIKKIRNERTFNAKEQLISQLKRDEKRARTLLK